MKILEKLKRKIKFFFQRRLRGFDDSEIWSLDQDLAKHILPRLKRYKEVNGGHPQELSWEQWMDILDEMIQTFEFLASDAKYDCFDKSKWKEINKGLHLFAKYYSDLWW